MAEVKLSHQGAVGPCVVCGEDSEGSQYWVAMSHETWLKLVPYIEHRYAPGMVLKGTYFIAPYDKPLCSSRCALQRKGHD